MLVRLLLRDELRRRFSKLSRPHTMLLVDELALLLLDWRLDRRLRVGRSALLVGTSGGCGMSDRRVICGERATSGVRETLGKCRASGKRGASDGCEPFGKRGTSTERGVSRRCRTSRSRRCGTSARRGASGESGVSIGCGASGGWGVGMTVNGLSIPAGLRDDRMSGTSCGFVSVICGCLAWPWAQGGCIAKGMPAPKGRTTTGMSGPGPTPGPVRGARQAGLLHRG